MFRCTNKILNGPYRKRHFNEVLVALLIFLEAKTKSVLGVAKNNSKNKTLLVD